MTCSDNSTCTSCGYDNVLTEGECVEMKSISNCITALKGKCVECSSWHQPNQEGTECESKIEWWLIILIVAIVIALVAIAIAGGLLLYKKLKK